MTFTVNADLTDFDLAESATPWSTGDLDADYYVQGSNSVGFYMSKNARGSVTINATDQTWATGDHLYFWISSSVAAKMESKTTGTGTASGVTVRVTLANAAYSEWHVAGADTWGGEWKCFVIDMGHTGTERYATSGTFSSASQIAEITLYFDLSNSGNIRNVPANTWGDAIRFGTGLTAYNTSAADPSFGFADIAAEAELIANAYGITETIDGVVFCQGRLTVGDTGTNHLDFDSQDEVLVFRNRSGDGEGGIVGDALYGVDFVANATGSDQDVNFGIKVGTGDTMTGRNGTLILPGGSSVVYYVDASDADMHNFGMYGVTIRGAVGGTTYGVDLAAPTTTFEIAASTFDGCVQLSLDDAVTRNCNFLNSASVATSGALYWDNGTTDVENCLFVNNSNAVEVVTLGADMTFSNMTFSGNTYDVRYEGASDYDLNWSGGTEPTVNDAGAGTLTPVSSVDYILTNIANPSEVTILDRDVTLESWLSEASGNPTDQAFGNLTTLEKVGQSLQVTTAGKADRVRFQLKKVGSPTDEVFVRLVTGGVPGTPGHLSLPGTDEFVRTTTAGTTNGQSDFTVIMLLQNPDWSPTVLETPLTRWETGGDRCISVQVTTAGLWQLVMYDSTNTSAQTYTTTDPSLTNGNWYWIRISYDDNNGSSQSQADFDWSADPPDTDPDSVSWTNFSSPTDALWTRNNPNDVPWTIGCRGASGGDENFWTGGIAYVEFKDENGDYLLRNDWRLGYRFGADTQDDEVGDFIWEFNGTAPVFYPVFESESISGTDLTTSLATLDFLFPGSPSVATSTTYGFEVHRSGAINASDYYVTRASTVGGYGSGSQYRYNAGAWVIASGSDNYFAVMEAASENQLYHVETLTSGTTTYTHGGAAKSIEVLIAALVYQQVVLVDTIGADEKSVPILQVPDLVYST